MTNAAQMAPTKVSGAERGSSGSSQITSLAALQSKSKSLQEKEKQPRNNKKKKKPHRAVSSYGTVKKEAIRGRSAPTGGRVSGVKK